jgi:hypothetical protein
MRVSAAFAIALSACEGPRAAPKCQLPLSPGELVITEVFARAKNPPGAARWFELYNASDATLVLDGAQLGHQLASKNKFYGHYVTSLSIPPGGYAALGDAPPDQLPAYLAYGYGTDLGALDDDNAGGTLSVRCGPTEIASLRYTQYQIGHARALGAGLPPTAALEGDPTSWCEATASTFATGNYGTPGAANDCVPASTCVAGGTLRAISPPAVGQLVISEVMTDPLHAPRTTGEWFEGTALAAFDLNGLALGRARTTTKPEVITAADCITLGSGSRVVFAKTTDPTQNGGLPAGAVAWTFSFALVEGSSAAPGDVRVLATDGTTVIDSVTWMGSIPGASWQLDPGAIDATANDNFTNWCLSTTAYGSGDLGTPAAANLPCNTGPPIDAGASTDAPADAAQPDGQTIAVVAP